MLSDSDEDSEDFLPAASQNAEEPACSEENCEESGLDKPPPEDPEEQVISRIARLWRQHVSEQSHADSDGPDLSDRLAASAEYRRWVREIDAGLESGQAAPSFTELWIELNKRPAVLKGSEAARRSPSTDPRARFDRWSQDRKPRWHSAQEALEVLLDSLKQLEASPKRKQELSACELSATMRKRSPDFAIKETPFEKLGKLLQLAAQDGWIRLTWSGDTMSVQILELPANGVTKLVDAWEREEDVGFRLEPARQTAILKEVNRVRRVVHEERAERGVCNLALKPAPGADPLADFAAEGSVTYLRQAVARLSASERGKVRPERPPRTKAVLAPAARSRYDREESLRIFNESLQDLCAQGLEHDLPMNASVILRLLRRLGFSIEDTPFESFPDLLDAAARKEYLEVGRRGHDPLITWVKYRYRVLTRRDEHRPDRERLPAVRRRSRSRHREVSPQWSRGAPGQGHQGDPGRERSRGHRLRRAAEASRSREKARDALRAKKDVRKVRCEPSSKKKASKAATSKAAASKAASKAAAKKKGPKKSPSCEKDAERKASQDKQEQDATKKATQGVKRPKKEEIPLIAGKAKSKAAKKTPAPDKESSSEYEYYSYYSEEGDKSDESSSSSESDEASSG